jgi:3-hydroxybutyrate dehydrogenase
MPTDPFASLKGQVAVVTGSTSGIGQALAEALAERGVKVVLNGLGDPAAIEKTRADMEAQTGSPVRYHGADMMKPEQIADMVDYAKREFGRSSTSRRWKSSLPSGGTASSPST